MNTDRHGFAASRPPVALLVAVLAALAVLAGSVILFEFDPDRSWFYPACQFHRVTGLLCPGCGSLRALHHLLHGRIALALHFNALLVLCLPWAAWFAARALLRFLRSQPLPSGIRPAWLWCAVAATLCFGVLRNVF